MVLAMSSVPEVSSDAPTAPVPAVEPAESVPLSLDDLAAALQYLERAASRGGFELSEFEDVGRLHRVLRCFLAAHGRRA
jgi:hypothetical protein